VIGWVKLDGGDDVDDDDDEMIPSCRGKIKFCKLSIREVVFSPFTEALEVQGVDNGEAHVTGTEVVIAAEKYGD
jgi:hypothetical protein